MLMEISTVLDIVWETEANVKYEVSKTTNEKGQDSER